MRETVNFVSRESPCFPIYSRQLLFSPSQTKTFSEQIYENKSRKQSTFTGNSALLPTDIKDFAIVSNSEILAGNSFIVRCHVTSKKPMRMCPVGKKFPAI